MSEALNDDDLPAWDANDPRRQHDQMAPPSESCECYCLHCERIFMSDEMWFQRVIGSRDGFDGFWRCPTPNCDGAGFTFDIYPTDPDHPANDGWSYDDDDDVDEEEFEEMEWTDIPEDEWDPSESQYEGNDDIEGEEWKFGLQPGEELDESHWSEARREWEEEQRMYDAPDERPRELDWSNRPEEPGSFRDDDIPF
jgi:hypothetical protein